MLDTLSADRDINDKSHRNMRLSAISKIAEDQNDDDNNNDNNDNSVMLEVEIWAERLGLLRTVTQTFFDQLFLSMQVLETFNTK